MDRQFDVLYCYLALAKRPRASGLALEDRTRLLVRQLSADRSGCRWCIAHARHDWRAGGLPVDLLRELGRHESSDAFTDRERAALALMDSVACARQGAVARTLARLGRVCPEPPVAGIISCMAEHQLIADEHP
jgi:alkylhydroperoxidase family enzyme